ncbi:MAG: hypothetical protein DRJ65_09115 [Acidobacteria bacterium]|nr:MAG: hypothetical protein DRJ65_09115 [Acidobacteriota bacterium]
MLCVSAPLRFFLPLLLPFAPGIGWSSVSEVRELVAICMALGLGWVLALFLGAGMVGGDLVQGRLGFYFSRPVSGGAIWWGKVVANVLLVFAAELIILLPAFVFLGANPFFAFNSANWWVTLDLLTGGSLSMIAGLLIGVPLLLLLVSHAIGIMWRARSAWMALDAALFVALLMVLWLRLASLAMEAPLAVIVISGFFVFSVLAVLFLAGWAQVSFGRTDIQRGHRVLSGVLWSGVFVTAVTAIGYGAWIVDAAPDDLDMIVDVDSAPKGPWINVYGTAPHRLGFMPQFLFNRVSRDFVRITHCENSSRYLAFSSDGRRAAWVRPVGNGNHQLVYADLGADRATIRETLLTFDDQVSLVLSDDGTLVAIPDWRQFAVYELETGRLVIATRLLEPGYVRTVGFLPDGRLRVLSLHYSDGAIFSVAHYRIYEIDLATGKIETSWKIEPARAAVDDCGLTDDQFYVSYNKTSDRFLVVDGCFGRYRLTVREGRDGVVMRDFGRFHEENWPRWSLDGRRIFGAFVEDGRGWLEILSVADGMIVRWPLGPAEDLRLAGESEYGEVLVACWLPDAERALAVDIETGVIRPILGGSNAAADRIWRGFWVSRDARLMLNEAGALLEWDLENRRSVWQGAWREISRDRCGIGGMRVDL